jgi:hypothetical protein
MKKARNAFVMAMCLGAVGCSDDPSSSGPGEGSGDDTVAVHVKGYYFGKHYETSVPTDCDDAIGRAAVGTEYTITEMLDGGREEGDVLVTGTFDAEPVLGQYQGRAACVLEGGTVTVPRVDLMSVGTADSFGIVKPEDLEAAGGVAWVSFQP